jgi:monoamine oxidase
MISGKYTRRQFLKAMGVGGGTLAMWATLKSWGLAAPTAQTPPPLEGSGDGTSVLILGAGIGGLVSAYELSRLGYDITILEARDYPGGHCWTVRRGSELNEYGGERQVCDFDEGLWANLGPWRLPHHHKGILHYCKVLNVPLQVFVNYQANDYSYIEGDVGPLSGKPLYERQWRANMAGYTSELLAKAARDGRLDGDLTGEQVEMLIEYLRGHGLLDDDLTYTGSYRAGWETPPGAGTQTGEPLPPIPFDELLPWSAELMNAQSYYLAAMAARTQQMTMLQPIGGMDRIPYAFEEALGEEMIRYQHEVTEIRQSEDQVRVVYRNLQTGETGEMTADYCLCNIPLPVLTKIPADFEPEMREAIGNIDYVSTGKIGLQFSRRFWEEDDNIFGGSTRTNNSKIGDLHYYAYNFLGEKGIIQGYYNFGLDALEVSRLSMQDRIEFALDYGSKIHPQYRESFETGFSVAWHRVPYSLGGWPGYTEAAREYYYPRLLEPDGRVYLVGEHLSHVTGWMEGAVLGAWLQIEKLHQRVRQ